MITCPNVNDENWKELVNTVGIDKAVNIYSNLNGTYPILGMNEDGTVDLYHTKLTEDFGKEIADKLWYDKFTIENHYSLATNDNASPYYSNTLSLSQQLTLVDTIAYNINSELVAGKKVEASEIIDRWKAYYDSLGTSEGASDALKKAIANVDSSWGVITNLVKLKLSSIQGINVKSTNKFSKIDKPSEVKEDLNDDDQDELKDTTAINERINFSDDWSLFIDGKTTLSSQLKRVFSAIRDLDENGKVKNDFLGSIKVVPFDRVYNSIIPILTNSKPNFNKMIQTLESYTTSSPYLRDVIDTLKSSSKQIQNEFVANASNHYVRMQYLGWNKDSFTGKDGVDVNTYSMIPSNTNTNDIAYVINNKWINNLVNTPLLEKLKDTEEELTYSLPLVTSIIEDIATLYKVVDPLLQVSGVKNLFTKIGIQLSDETVNSLIDNGYKHENTKLKYSELFTSKKGVFNILAQRLQAIKHTPTITYQDYALFDDNVFNTLAKLEAKFTSNDFSNSHTRGDNKIVSSYARNKFFTDRINELKTNENLRSNLGNINFSSTSDWLKFLNDETSAGYNNFNYFYADVLTHFGVTESPTTLAAATPSDHEIYILGMFMNRGTVTDKGERFGRIMFPTMSDGTSMFGVNTKLHDTQMTNGKLGITSLDALYNALVAPELKRIMRYKEMGRSLNIEGYDKGATKFIMLANMNEIFNTTIGESKLNDTDYKAKEFEFKTKAYSEIEKYVEALVKEKQDKYLEYGILRKRNEQDDNGLPSTKIDGKTYTAHFIDKNYNKKILKNIKGTDKIQYLLHDIEVNYLIGKSNFHQLVIGDPALYYKKGEDDYESSRLTFDNISKRLAGDRAPGISLADSDTNTFIQIFAQDAKITTLNKELEAIKAYQNIKSTDAQEFSTFREHLYVMSKLGKIKEDDINELVDKEIKGTLSNDDLNLVLQVQKPVNVQHIESIKDDVSHRYYIKSSSYPLIRQLTKGLELDKLREKMEALETREGKTVRLAFGTAVKIGNINNPIELYDNKTGNVKDDINFDGYYTVLNRSGFKIQQEVPEGHTDVNVVSQAAVLIFNDILKEQFKHNGESLSGLNLQAKYFDKYGQIYKLQYDKLLKDLDWKEAEGTIDINKLKEIFDAEVESGSFDLNAAAGVTIKDGEFTHRLTFNPNIYKYEAVLNSVIDSRIRKIKFNGSSFVLSTEEGYKSKGKIAGQEDIIDHPGIVFTKSWSGRLQSNQIIIPNRFRNNDGSEIDFTEKNAEGDYVWLKKTKDGYILDESKIDKDLLDILGFRIPNQGHSSMTSPTIVGFLPKNSGDLVIASRDLVVQMGSDFDVDKLYTYIYTHRVVTDANGNKNLVRYTSKTSDVETLQNDIMDIYKTILRSKNKLVDSLQYKPLDSDHVINIANEIALARKDKMGENPYFTAMSSSFDRNTFFENRDGKAGVATFSAASVLNANLQEKGIAHGTYMDKDFMTTVIEFGDQQSTIFSDNATTEGYNFTKSDVIKWDQSESVDNAKNKRLAKLGLNTDTFNAKLALNQFGFVDEGYWFINQDIIHDYVNEINKLKGAGNTSFEKDGAFKNIQTKYEDLALINGDDEFTLDTEEGQSKYSDLSGKDLPLDKMKLLIGKDGNKIKNYATIQLSILNKFRQLNDIGISLKQLTSTTNTNSKGLGNSIMENVLKEEQLVNIFTSKDFINADKLIGDFVTDEFYNEAGRPKGYFQANNLSKGTNVWIKPNTINGYASVYAILTANKMYKEHFNDYFNHNTNSLVSKILEIAEYNTEGNTKSIAKVKQKIFTEYRSYVYTNNKLGLTDNVKAERKAIMYDVWQNDKHIKKSLASILNDIQKTKLGITNPFLNKLTFDIKKGDSASLIKFNSSSSENLDELNIHLGFIDLIQKERPIEGLNITTKELASIIVKYVYLTGGKTNFTSFIKFIPDSYLTEIGFNDAVKQYKTDLSMIQPNIYYDLHPFVSQYFQHNPEEVGRVDIKDLVNSKTVIKDNHFAIAKPKLGKYEVKRRIEVEDGKFANRDVPVEMLRVTKGKVTQLYKYVMYDIKGNEFSDGLYHYRRIATLGEKGNNEYDEGNKDATSAINKNNSVLKVIGQQIGKPSGIVIDNKTSVNSTISEQYGITDIITHSNEVKNVLTNIVNQNESPLNSFVAKAFLDSINKNNIKLAFKTDNTLGSAGMFNNTVENGETIIYLNSNEINKNTDLFRYTVLHEMTHVLTLYAAKNTARPEDNAAVRRLRGIFNEVVDTIGKDKVEALKTKLRNSKLLGQNAVISKEDNRFTYGGTDLQEMIALTMNSPEFQVMLNNIKYRGTDTSFWKHVLDRLVELFKVLGMDIKPGSALHYAMNDIFSLADRRNENGDSNTEIPNKILDEINNKSSEIKTIPTGEFTKEELTPHSITLHGKKGDVTIDTGKIQVNEQQSVALSKMADFLIDPNKTTFALKGYAGTGKTTIMEFIKDYLDKSQPFTDVYFSSPTHRANTVLKQRVKNANVKTLHSLLGLSPIVDLEEFDARTAKFDKNRPDKIQNDSVLIIDESSMINKELFKLITDTATAGNIKVIFVGDPKQLKPVKEDTISKAFSFSQDSYELTKVERTGDNPLLEQATLLREDKPLTKVTKLNSKDEGVAFTSNPTKFLESATSLFTSAAFEENKLLVRVIAGTNSRVNELNKILRKGIYGENVNSEYNIGELLMGYNNYKIDFQTKEPLISNSGDYIVKAVSNTVTKTIEGIPVKGYSLTIQDLNVKDRVSIKYIFMLSKDNDASTFTALGKKHESLRVNAIERASKGDKSGWKAYYAYEEAFASPIPIMDGDKVKIKKTLDYGYAHTIHKSQGGTYNYSFVDDNSIEDYFKDKETRQQLKYVGVSRASQKSVILTRGVAEENTYNSPMESEDEERDISEVSTANKVLISEQYRRIALINKEVNVLSQDRTTANISRIGSLMSEISTAKENIQVIKTLNGFKALTLLADVDLDDAKLAIERGNLSANDITRIESKLSIWKHGIRELLTNEEASLDLVRKGNIEQGGEFKGYEYYQNEATRLDDKLIKLREQWLQNWLKENRGKDVDILEIWKNQKDIGSMPAYTLDISHTDNVILTSIDKFIKENAIYEKDNLMKTYHNIEHITNKAMKDLESIKKPGSNIFDSLKQLTKNGKETGNLISPYSHEYYKAVSDLYYVAKNANSKVAWQKYYKFKSDHEITFDFRKLFPNDKIFTESDDAGQPITYTDVDRDAHITELKRHLGERGYEKLSSILNTKYEFFKADYEINKARIEAYSDLNDTEKAREFDLWDKTNSPYWYAKIHDDFNSVYRTSGESIINNHGLNYTFSIPKRFDKEGNKTNWYDANFDKIAANENLYNFHEMITDTLAELNGYLPLSEQTNMQDNLIPTIKKSIYEIFSQDGMKEAGRGMLDQMLEQLTDKEASDISFANVNPETHKIEKDLRVNFINDNREAINDLTTRKEIAHLTSTGKTPTPKDSAKFKEEATDEVSKNRSFDLPKIMKIYASLVHTYKYKAKVEDVLKIADNIINKAVETEKTINGSPITNGNTGKVQNKPDNESFKNLKSQWDYFIQNFYGKRYQKENILTHTEKHYTSKEKETLDELREQAILLEKLWDDKKISQAAYTATQEDIQNQINKLGGVYVDSQIGREFLKFIQIKGMGWNAFSAFSNVGFGIISNMVQSADGRVFNGKELRTAYALTMGSMLKNYTFGKIETPTAEKIRSLMDKWDLHSEMANELYKRSEVSMIGEKTKWMGPYSMQQRSEYMNQAPLMIATLMHTKLKMEDGTEYQMWEAFDNKGNWNTEKYGSEPKEQIVKTRLRIEQTIKRLHGNFYSNSPIKVNDKFITSALRQFRTWMFEGFHDRFGSEKYDDLMELTQKGQYNTFFQSMFNAKKLGEQNGFNNACFTALQMIKKVSGFKTNFDDRFNEVDAANMRKAIMELLIYMTMSMIALGLRAAANGDDDDKKKRDKYMLNYMLNMGTRLQTDISFYTNPMSFSALTQNAIPCATVIKDVYKWGTASGRLLIGDDQIKTGVYSGSSRWLRETSALLPFFTQVRKTIGTSIQEIKH